jgi:high-affinity iron transporter
MVAVAPRSTGRRVPRSEGVQRPAPSHVTWEQLTVDIGSFTSGLLTGLREGVEAALIVSIVLAYLARTGNRRHFGKIWAGTAAAVAVSLVAGIALHLSIGGLEEPYEQIFEGAAMVAAAVVVTWMLFWMRRQAASVGAELRAAVDRVLTEGRAVGLAVLAFTAVIREGLETALFLVGQARSAETGAPAVLLGAVAGLGVAVLLGVGFYRGARLLNLRTFFRWSGIALIFIAAGLLSHAVHEFIEIGWITVGTGTLFDISMVLPHSPAEGAPGGLVLLIGQFLRALFGYTSSPEVITFVVWAAYVVLALALFLRPAPAPAAAKTTPAPGASGAH